MDYWEATRQAVFFAHVEDVLEDILRSRVDDGRLWMYFKHQEGTVYRSWGDYDEYTEDAEDSM